MWNFGRAEGRSRVRIVREMSAPAMAMTCWLLLCVVGSEAARRAVVRPEADLMPLCRRLWRIILPREDVVGISRSSSSAPVRPGSFCSSRTRFGVKNRRERKVGRALVVAKASGCGAP